MALSQVRPKAPETEGPETEGPETAAGLVDRSAPLG